MLPIRKSYRISSVAAVVMMACGTTVASAAGALPQPDADMKAVLDELAALGAKPVETLTPAQARKQPTPADAVKKVMAKKGLSTAPDPAVTTQNVTYKAGDGSMQKARVYKPANASGTLPVVMYIHGGGWVIADIDVYDASPRALAQMTGAIVVSIEYRHAPEAKFPAAHQDANAAYQWIQTQAASWGGDPKRLALVGESAGGNMAMNVAISAREQKWTQPRHIVAVYPVAAADPQTRSKLAFVDAKPLGTPALPWFFKHMLTSPSEAKDPRLDLVNANLTGLPATTIVLAEIDPLHDDGELLADRLRAADVKVDMREYKGVTHEFFGMGAVVADAKTAEKDAADALKTALGK